MKATLWATLLLSSIGLMIYAYCFMPATTNVGKRSKVIVILTNCHDGVVDRRTVDSLVRQSLPPTEITAENATDDDRVTVYRKGSLHVREMDADVRFVIATNGRVYGRNFIERSVRNFEQKAALY